ncbi:hypothetical protein Bbelb_259600 [Branchiostoma belcheri]|nr:hypothetical protein Bbelb_259600 [Branchiostoma belcheri]
MFPNYNRVRCAANILRRLGNPFTGNFTVQTGDIWTASPRRNALILAARVFRGRRHKRLVGTYLALPVVYVKPLFLETVDRSVRRIGTFSFFFSHPYHPCILWVVGSYGDTVSPRVSDVCVWGETPTHTPLYWCMSD